MTPKSRSFENRGRSRHAFLDFSSLLFLQIGARTRDLLVHQFRQVDGGHLSFHPRDLDRIFYIHHAERTGRHDHVGSGLRGHLHSLHAHSLLFFRLVEQHQSAATAAERAVTGSAHLDSLQPWNRIQHIARIVVNLVVPTQIAGIVVDVDVVFVLYRIELDLAGFYFSGNHLADVLHRRHILIVVFQRVVGVRVSSDDPPDSGRLDGLHVVVAQGHEKRLFAEPPNFMAAISFRRAQDSEILSDMIEDLGRRPPDRLHPVVVGSDAVDKIQSVRAIVMVKGFDSAGLLEFLAFAQSALFFSILP